MKAGAMFPVRKTLDFEAVNAAALAALPGLLPRWLPNGRLHGREYKVGDLQGNPGDSLSINTQSGVWKDFATGDGGSDPISLYAALHGLDQGDACRQLSEQLNGSVPPPSMQPRATVAREDNWKPIVPAPAPPPRNPTHPQLGKPDSIWHYHDVKGRLLYLVFRFDKPNGSDNKKFRGMTYGERNGKPGWHWKHPNAPMPLYKLDLLAQRPSDPVLVVEGEKTADAAQRLCPELVCVTWPRGTGNVEKVDWSPLAGRRCGIWPDADMPGVEAAEKIAARLISIGAASVAIIDPPKGVLKKWDLANAEAEGWNTDRVMEYMRQHKRVEPAPAGPGTSENAPSGNVVKIPTTLKAVSIGEFLSLDIPPRVSILSPWLQRQGLNMIYGKRGIGKTHVALGVAYAVATGGRFLRWEAPEPRRVLYVDGEMPAATMQQRMSELVNTMPNEPPSEDYLRIITPDLQEFGIPDLSSEDGHEAIGQHLEGVDLLVLDNLSTLCRFGRENEAESWQPVQTWTLGLRRRGLSVLFVHHAGKGGQQRGTSRREDVLDTVIRLRHGTDYTADQGAKFEVRFDKARGLIGEDAAGFEAELGPGGWTTRSLEDAITARVVELHKDGCKQREIASELEIGVGTVNRHLKRAREQGLLDG